MEELIDVTDDPNPYQLDQDDRYYLSQLALPKEKRRPLQTGTQLFWRFLSLRRLLKLGLLGQDKSGRIAITPLGLAEVYRLKKNQPTEYR